MELLNKKGIIEMLALVKEGKVSIVRDNYGNIVSINCNHPEMKVNEIRYMQNLGNGMAVGTTPEQLEEDVRAMRQFAEDWAHTDVMHLTLVAERLAKPTLTEEDIAYLKRELESYVASHREVKVVERVVREPAPRTEGRGRYPGLFENLYVLDIPTLKEMKRAATRNGADDLKNACRTVLRHKGVNC